MQASSAARLIQYFRGRFAASAQKHGWGRSCLSAYLFGGLLAAISATDGVAAVVHVSAGMNHTIFVLADGTLAGMGSNGEKQLGDPTITFRTSRPMRIAAGVSSGAAGREHTLFVKTDGTLWGMGNNASGQLGDGTKTDRATPVLIASGVVQVATRSEARSASESAGIGPHTMFVKADGTLWATGGNHLGQLGDGTKENRVSPVQVATEVASVGVGTHYTLFVKTDSTLWRMGRSISGGRTADHLIPVQIATAVKAVSCGADEAVAIKSDGTLWEFGNSFEGGRQIADNVQSAAYGHKHVVFIKTDGTLWGRGSYQFGELGEGTTGVAEPVLIASSVAKVSAGYHQTFFVKNDGSLWATGYNPYGQLGDGTTTDRKTPTEVTQLLGLPSIAWPPENEAMQVRATGTLTVYANGSPPLSYQWLKDSAELPGATQSTLVLSDVSHEDVGSYQVRVSNPLGSALSDPGHVLVTTPMQRAKEVSVASTHSLVLQEDGTLWATGENSVGQLGDGSTNSHHVLTKIATGVATVSTSLSHTLFVKADGTLWGMGENLYGPAEPSSPRQPRLTPQQLATGVRSVSAGGEHAMFIKTDGTLWGMGGNRLGALGIGYWGDNVRTPVEVSRDVASVSAGRNHTVFVKTDGTLWAMGQVSVGDLPSPVLSPLLVTDEVVSASAGATHTVFVKTDGSLWGFGDGENDQLAPFWPARYKTPVQLATGVRTAIATSNDSSITVYLKTDGTLWGMGSYGSFVWFADILPFDGEQAYLGYEEIRAIAASSRQLAFIRRDGSLWAVGRNSFGQLGIGSVNDIFRPRQMMHAEVMPVFTTHPASLAGANGAAVTLTAAARGAELSRFQWSLNGAELAGRNSPSLSLSNLRPVDAGLYRLEARNEIGDVASDAAIVGLATMDKIVGAGEEVLSNQYVEMNRNTFDQVLLKGAAVAVKADFSPDPAANQITRTSFVDLDGDIVQVEFSGPGTLSLVLDEVSGPAVAENYHQAVEYMKGHAGIVITGANEFSNLSVFSVGRATAVNPALFKDDVDYDGIADIAFIAISTTNGKFGGVRTANAQYFAERGLTGVYAPGVAFQGPVFVGDVTAFGAAEPVLVLGSASDVRVTGGDMAQPNGRAVAVSGIAELKFTAGGDSHGRAIEAQANGGVFTEQGQDVTARIVVGP